MHTNDTLVLQLIKHLVRKSEETNLAELFGETAAIVSKDTPTDLQTRLSGKILGQLSKIEETLLGLRQQVKAWVSPTLMPQVAQINGTQPKNGALPLSLPTHTQYPAWLLQPQQALKVQLPQSTFLYDQPYTTSFNVETKDKHIYFYAFMLPEADPTGEVLSFLHHQLNRHLFIHTQTDLVDVLVGFDRAMMVFMNEMPQIAQASQAKFIIGKIDKAQAALSFIHSGMAVYYTQDEALQSVPLQHIALGQRGNNAPQVHTLSIKRNTQFHITTPLEKAMLETFSTVCPTLPAKQQNAWWEKEFATKNGNPAMLLSFGF